MTNLKIATITKDNLNKAKNGEIVETSIGYVTIKDHKAFKVGFKNGIKYTNVYIPNPQGQGKTTLSLKELVEATQRAKQGESYIIYRGDVRDNEGNLIPKDTNNVNYTSKATKIEIRLILDEFEEPRSVELVSQSQGGLMELKEEIKLSLLQEIEL